jgi:plasmid stabilization system protein ParE
VKLLWTKEAIFNLHEIENFIARDNLDIAIKFVDKLIDKADTLVENPKKGRVVPELSVEQIREILYKNYRIVYLLKKNSIDILTVFESHKLLREDEIIKRNK